MSLLKLHNTLTREKKLFTPLDESNVRLYTCGITPYDYAHIGNLRTMVVFDVLYRLLTHLYPKVTYVRNYTDIDDKIVERAQEVGKEPFALAAEYIEIFERDMARLNLLTPTHQPRVSQHLQGIVAMVNGLLEKGFAYVTPSGDVMFNVPAFEKLGSPHDKFGYLARRTFENTQARVEEDLEKNDPRDFPVWKANAKSATKLEQAFNPVELGATFKGFIAPGRPGWHIECSVMSQSLLAPNPTPGEALFDIHGGGEDLAFPHHSCEIAQSEAFNPTCTMSSVWMHAAFVTVNGTKMSKSLGNYTTVEDVLQKYSPEAVRLWLLQTHYRKPVDFSDEALEASENALRTIKRRLMLAVELGVTVNEEVMNVALQSAAITLSDDLNTAGLLEELFTHSDVLINTLNNTKENVLTLTSEALSRLLAYLSVAGINYTYQRTEKWVEHFKAIREQFENLLNERRTARLNRNWSESDRIRDLLLQKYAIQLEDKPDGSVVASWIGTNE